GGTRRRCSLVRRGPPRGHSGQASVPAVRRRRLRPRRSTSRCRGSLQSRRGGNGAGQVRVVARLGVSSLRLLGCSVAPLPRWKALVRLDGAPNAGTVPPGDEGSRIVTGSA